tara:strand:+ start:306 stop:536 length:231 start_codon:yes stop_codon:yes gene_type:complete
MFLSNKLGRHFWVDDEYELRSCPSFVDNTGDFDNADYVSDWDDYNDVDVSYLLNIYKSEIHNKLNYGGSLSFKEVA